MGWLYPYGASRKDIINERCAPWKWSRGNVGASGKTLKKCLRGNVLWRVVEVYRKDTGHIERYIACDLLQTDLQGNWGYKDIDESMGPYQTSCPLSYLKGTMVLNKKWRGWVREYHQHKREVRARRKALR